MDQAVKIIPNEKFKLFTEYWSPKVVGDLNDHEVKLVKLKGKLDWHHHEDADELFIVVKGTLTIRFRDQDLVAEPGEMILVPKMVEHSPVAKEEVWIIFIDPKGTLNTGNLRNDQTTEEPERI